jgi:hypothetical protein
MAVKYIRTGKSSFQSSASLTAHAKPAGRKKLPEGLSPIRLSAFQMDEYRLRSGWPTAVPDYDIRARTLASAEGEVITDRETPFSITTGALTRWVADEEYYDTTSLTWTPLQSSVPLVWESSTEYAPTFLPQYEYGVNEERFYQNGLNFDSDSREHMWCNMNAALAGAAGYTVIMVANLNSVYGNNLDLPYNGIWCPGRATPLADTFSEPISDAWVAVHLQGGYIYVDSDEAPRTRSLPVSDLLASEAPVYLAMVIGKPTTVIYAGTGPSTISRNQVRTGDRTEPLTGDVVLGRTRGDVLHTADMTVMDLGIYADRLTREEVAAEFALLSSVYGGDK